MATRLFARQVVTENVIINQPVCGSLFRGWLILRNRSDSMISAQNLVYSLEAASD